MRSLSRSASVGIAALSLAAIAVMGGGVAVLAGDSEAAGATDQTVFCSKYVPNEKATWASGKPLAKWASQNPGERDRWDAWQAAICAGQAPASPAVATQHGVTLVAAGEMVLLADVTPTTTSTTTSTGTTTSTTTTTTTTDTTTTTTPVGCAVSTPNVPDGPDNAGGCFPGPSNTGPNAPASSMATYTGPCAVSTPNVVIDSKVVNCQVIYPTSTGGGLVIKNSYVNGGVGRDQVNAKFTIQDSLIDDGQQYPACGDGSCPAGKYACGSPINQTSDCGVTGSNFTILRTEIINSNRAAFCQAPGPCLVQDNYFHGTNLWPDASNKAHASSMREEQNLTLRHNSLHCSYTGPFVNSEIGCSADLTGYPDFAPIKNNTVDGNLFVASIGSGFCVYGGGTTGKPFSGDPTNATNQKFTNNVFQRGSNNKCAAFGPITDFITGRTGNVWSGNVWDNGGSVSPA